MRSTCFGQRIICLDQKMRVSTLSSCHTSGLCFTVVVMGMLAHITGCSPTACPAQSAPPALIITVKDRESYTGLSMALVRIWRGMDAAGTPVTERIQGEFFDNEGGWYTIEASHPDYVPQTKSVEVLLGHSECGDVPATKSVDFLLAKAQ